jgi:DNA-binding CsgD family transcriptional regulator
MSTFVLLEDTFVIFYVDDYTGPGIKIFNRNFSENILFCGLALLFSFRCSGDIGQMYKKVQEYQAEMEAQSDIPAQMDPVRQFGLQYGLTDREMDILRCLLEEKSQQEISENLVIALGTVKTHTHNIYRKTDTANRNQIMLRYRQFLQSK